MARGSSLVSWREALIIGLAPFLLILGIVLQVLDAGFWYRVVPFVLLPFSFGVALIVADLVRIRWMQRRESRRG